MNQLKREDIRTCSICNGKHTSLVLYKMEVVKHLLDVGAIRRLASLEMYFGGTPQAAGVANVFSSDSNYSALTSVKTFIVCQSCMIERFAELIPTELEGDNG